jgi:hypothetical protein
MVGLLWSLVVVEFCVVMLLETRNQIKQEQTSKQNCQSLSHKKPAFYLD